MTLENGFFEWVLLQPSLVSLLQAGSITRVYKLKLEQDSPLPALVTQRQAVERSRTQCATIALARATLQIDSYGKTWDEAEGPAEALRSTLTDYVGMMGDVIVKNANLETEIDLDDPEPGIFRRSQTWSFWFVE